MSAEAGSVSIYRIPDHINTDEGREDYVRIELCVGDEDWIMAEKIIFDDFRPRATKPKTQKQ